VGPWIFEPSWHDARELTGSLRPPGAREAERLRVSIAYRHELELGPDMSEAAPTWSLGLAIGEVQAELSGGVRRHVGHEGVETLSVPAHVSLWFRLVVPAPAATLTLEVELDDLSLEPRDPHEIAAVSPAFVATLEALEAGDPLAAAGTILARGALWMLEQPDVELARREAAVRYRVNLGWTGPQGPGQRSLELPVGETQVVLPTAPGGELTVEVEAERDMLNLTLAGSTEEAEPAEGLSVALASLGSEPDSLSATTDHDGRARLRVPLENALAKRLVVGKRACELVHRWGRDCEERLGGRPVPAPLLRIPDPSVLAETAALDLARCYDPDRDSFRLPGARVLRRGSPPARIEPSQPGLADLLLLGDLDLAACPEAEPEAVALWRDLRVELAPLGSRPRVEAAPLPVGRQEEADEERPPCWTALDLWPLLSALARGGDVAPSSTRELAARVQASPTPQRYLLSKVDVGWGDDPDACGAQLLAGAALIRAGQLLDDPLVQGVGESLLGLAEPLVEAAVPNLVSDDALPEAFLAACRIASEAGRGKRWKVTQDELLVARWESLRQSAEPRPLRLLLLRRALEGPGFLCWW